MLRILLQRLENVTILLVNHKLARAVQHCMSSGIVVRSRCPECNIIAVTIDDQITITLHRKDRIRVASGSTNNDGIANVTDINAFAASAVALVSKFGFDGIDIDDEIVGSAFNVSRTVALVQATRAALSAINKTLLLTYDAYFYDGDSSWSNDPAHKDYARCFPPALLPSLDWVNIMAYNVALDTTQAANIYYQAFNTTFASWKLQLGGDFSKATIGVCVDKSCAFGPGPNATIIADWTSSARTTGTDGGMMVYAASSEVARDFAILGVCYSTVRSNVE